MAARLIKNTLSMPGALLQKQPADRKTVIATVFMVVYLALTSIWVYFAPQNLLAFLLFLASALLIYFLPMTWKAKLVISVVAALVIVPIVGIRNISYLDVIFQICLFCSLALGLNIMVGFTGLLNMGYVAFFAVGAYTWAFFGSQQLYLLHSVPGSASVINGFPLSADTFYLFMFIGLAVAAVVGILLGLPVLRVRGDYLAIVTLGFGEVIREFANNLDHPLNLTNGPQGVTPIQRPTLPTVVLDGLRSLLNPLIGHDITQNEFYNLFFYLLALLVILVVIAVVIRLNDSRIGRAWTAIREDEVAAVAMGIPLVKMKLAAFAIAASFAGVMGVVFAADRAFVSPESFTFLASINVLTMVILGGMGSIPGVIVGAAAVTILNEKLLQGLSLALNDLRQSGGYILGFAWKDLSSQLDPAKYQRLLFGLILIIMMIYRPAGIIPEKRRKRMPPGSSTPVEEENGTNSVAASTSGVTEADPEADHGAS
jgi:branched-chain amino acid transport system permease protein